MTSGQSSGHSSPGGDYETPDTQLVLSPQAPPRTYKGLGAGCGVHLPYRPGVGGKSCRRVDPAAPTAPAAATAASAAAPPVPARPPPRPRPRPAHADAGRRMEPRRARWVPAPLLCLGFHLLQAVLSTTVIPSCIPGESEDNCTALVQTEDNPRVAQVSISKCSSDMNGYCFHGQCIYLVDMSENHCRCEVGYTGVRCEHFFLTVQKPLSKEYVALTVILVILFLVVVAGSVYYFCRWYRYRKSKEPKKEYERVTSGDPALPQV
ncbi:proepiregulin [Phocoena sinus]|uniref:Proepiregulin n=1 Tax=Phocoena sinus TaxID=42100 RepID=A0A8C9BQD4_PHOSS|nr:proepiregulin [Phocoena sinus]